MASIERTAFPRLKRNPTPHELKDIYTPTPQDVEFSFAAARGEPNRLTVVVLLKTFQRLGYFPRLDQIPASIINHIAKCLRLDPGVRPGYDNDRTLYRHHRAIREYLVVTSYGKSARHIAIEAVHRAAQVMDNPADLINVAIEELIRQRYELPAFSTLDRLVRRVRTLVNTRFFHLVLSRLPEQGQKRLDQLLEVDDPVRRSDFNYLKEPPKSATLTHMHDLQVKLAWFGTFGDVDKMLEGIPNAKVKHFAAQARALDAAELKDFSGPKRYTLLLAMLHRTRITTRDNLVETFLKRMGKIHTNAKKLLEKLREQHRSKQEQLNATFLEVLEANNGAETDAEYGKRVRAVLAARGGLDSLRNVADEVYSYSGNNHLPLLWKYFKSHRRELFRMVRLLTISSTTQDQTLMQALDFLLENENRRADLLDASLDLSFANEQWQRTVMVRRNREVLFARRHLEVCVFSCLASELKSGDLCVKGSDEFADYRDQLMPWEECAPLVLGYCRDLGFTATAEGFVEELRTWLNDTAAEVDKGYPENGQLVITEAGEPVLKKLIAKEPSKTALDLEKLVIKRMPERTVLDILCNVEHWLNWSRHFGPLSGL